MASRTGTASSSAGWQASMSCAVERPVEPVVLGADAVAGRVGRDVGRRPGSGVRSRPCGLPVVDGHGDVDQLGMADDLVEGTEAQGGQQLADLLGDVLEEVDDELGPAA